MQDLRLDGIALAPMQLTMVRPAGEESESAPAGPEPAPAGPELAQAGPEPAPARPEPAPAGPVLNVAEVRRQALPRRIVG